MAESDNTVSSGLISLVVIRHLPDEGVLLTLKGNCEGSSGVSSPLVFLTSSIALVTDWLITQL
jgi:hypothetical protein